MSVVFMLVPRDVWYHLLSGSVSCYGPVLFPEHVSLAFAPNSLHTVATCQKCPPARASSVSKTSLVVSNGSWFRFQFQIFWLKDNSCEMPLSALRGTQTMSQGDICPMLIFCCMETHYKKTDPNIFYAVFIKTL